MHKHLQESWRIPYRVAKLLYRTRMAERLGRQLDMQMEGDNLIAELTMA
jgi:hypothetical protein